MPLLLQQLVEARLLVRVEQSSKLFFGLLQFLADLRADRFEQLSRAFLAGADDFVGLFLLLVGEIQFPLGAPEKFDPGQGRSHGRVDWTPAIVGAATACALRLAWDN